MPAGLKNFFSPNEMAVSEVDVSFNSFSEFLSMGGHGLYVWLSYGLGLAVILINLITPLQAGKYLRAQLTRRLLRENQGS